MRMVQESVPNDGEQSPSQNVEANPMQPMIVHGAQRIDYEAALGDEHCCGCCQIRIGIIIICLFMLVNGIFSFVIDPSSVDGFESTSYGGVELYVAASIMILISLIGIYGAITYNIYISTMCCRIVQGLFILVTIGCIVVAVTVDILIGVIGSIIYAYFAYVIHAFCSRIKKGKAEAMYLQMDNM
eukprot:473759_1